MYIANTKAAKLDVATVPREAHTRLGCPGSKTGLVRKPQGARGSCWKHLAGEAKCEREIGVALLTRLKAVVMWSVGQVSLC
jgi:hypothetical protein